MTDGRRKEEARKRKAERMRAYYAENRERLRAYKAEWRAQNKGKIRRYLADPATKRIGNAKWQELTREEEMWHKRRRTVDNSLVGAAERA